jgi:hypothetical protein
MLKILTCDEGESVTCAVLRIVDELGRDPSGFQWWASIVIPAVAAIASVAVLVFSVLTARSAKDQANLSERARVNAETARVEREQDQRFHDALHDFFASLAERIKAFDEHKETRRAALAAWHRKPTVYSDQPLPPGTAPIQAAIAALWLESATLPQQSLVDTITASMGRIEEKKPEERPDLYVRLMHAIAHWRLAAPEERLSTLRHLP